MVRRETAFDVGLFDESFVLNSEDLNFHLRLALQGVKFAGVRRALTYRHIHTNRIFRNIPGKLQTFLRALDTAFTSPACPADVQARRNLAYSNHYVSWAYQASVQDDIPLAQAYFRETIRLDPDWIAGEGRKLLSFLVHSSIRDGGEHASRLQTVFANLPEELAWLAEYRDTAIGRGYLLRGGRDLIWGRSEQAGEHFARALEMGARADQELISTFADQLSSLAVESGVLRAQQVWQELEPNLQKFSTPAQVRWVVAYLSLDQAFKDYYKGHFRRVPAAIFRAIWHDPSHLTDRGIMLMLARSLVGGWTQPGTANNTATR
jgi:hypothetical protein